jgi:hypothetical protein
MIYVERTQPSGGVRRGIIGAVDLECYEYKKGSDSLIRATEGTVLERIPPRVAVRRGAKIELPHVMLLIDDPKKTVIEPLANKNLAAAYDFDLMLGGGHIKGCFIDKEEQSRISGALLELAAPREDGLAPLLFAVGDGNHSLASAKASYEEIKAQLGEAAKSHPARYALCEVVNLYDDALTFEPIYRVMFGVDPDNVISELRAYAEGLCGSADVQDIKYVYGKNFGSITVKNPVSHGDQVFFRFFVSGNVYTRGFPADRITEHLRLPVIHIHDQFSQDTVEFHLFSAVDAFIIHVDRRETISRLIMCFRGA